MSTVPTNAERLEMLQAALAYHAQGWQPIPIPPRSKNPNRVGWQNERCDEAAIRREFSTPTNPRRPTRRAVGRRGRR